MIRAHTYSCLSKKPIVTATVQCRRLRRWCSYWSERYNSAEPTTSRPWWVLVERSGSGVELRTLDYENPGSNPGCGIKTLGKVFHSTLLQFTQLNQNEYLAIGSGVYVYEQPTRINCSIWVDASQRSRDGVWVNRSVREVKCKALWTVLRTGYCAI